jgi:hypothetical protein
MVYGFRLVPFTVSLFVNSCQQAFVELRDGATVNSDLINRFCKGIPSSQYTTGNMLYVRFFTDVTYPKNGFKAIVSIGKMQLWFYSTYSSGDRRRFILCVLMSTRDEKARIHSPSQTWPLSYENRGFKPLYYSATSWTLTLRLMVC